MAHLKKIDVGYLEKPGEVFIVAAATDADLILFECKTTRFEAKENQADDNIQYTVTVPKAFSDTVRRIHFPFGATDVKLRLNDRPLKFVTKEAIETIEFEEPVPLQGDEDIVLVYRLNPEKFSCKRCRLDISTSHLGTPIFELGLRGGHLAKPEGKSTEEIIRLLENHLVE